MAISRKPGAGRVLYCDFSGHVLPEMCGSHYVVVISDKKKNKKGMCIVVPITSSEDFVVPEHHIPLVPNQFPFITMDCYIKPDLIRAVSFDRLTILPEALGGSNAKVTNAMMDEIREKLAIYLKIA